MKKFVIIPNRQKDPDYAVTVQTIRVLKQSDTTVYVERQHEDLTPHGVTLYDESHFPPDAEIIIVLGGDGSILDAGHTAIRHDLPVLGINMGRLGYLAEVSPDELSKLSALFSDNYTQRERMTLDVTLIRKSGERTSLYKHALNDIVVSHGQIARLADLELCEGDKKALTYRADGLIVATPCGSTAYSLSAGGPIVDPKLSCFCVTPICPHSLSARPLVFPDTANLRIKNICNREKVLHLTLDGRVTFDLYFGDTVCITRSDLRVQLLRLKDESFYSKIRMKKFV
jgi:NAD+ kinase